MATITSLPDEVIDIILGDENISIKDAMSFKSTCEKFHEMIHSNKFWETKFYQRCPSARKKYNTEKREKIFKYLDFKEKIKANIKCIKFLQHYVHMMSNNNLSDTDKKELGHQLIFIAEDSMTYYFVLDEINTIISPDIDLWNLGFNLAVRYNFDRINNYLRQYRFIYKLNKFLNMPKEKRLFERLIMIMTQYFQPCVSYPVIKTFLDNMAHKVLSLIKNKYPKHSIFSTSPEQISFWRDNNIERNFWNRKEAMQIIEILDDFTSNRKNLELYELLKTLDPKFILEFIDDPDDTFLTTISYQCVARRLGIYCCTTYAEFCINDCHEDMWKPKYYIEDMMMEEYYFKHYRTNSIAFYNATEEWPYNGSLYELNDIKVIRIMMFFLYEFCLYEIIWKYTNMSPLDESEFSSMSPLLESGPSSTCNYLMCIYLNRWFRRYKNIKEINIEDEYINITQSIQDRSDILYFERSEKPKIRNKEIEFAIGMIITHTQSDEYNIDGVIIGWHERDDVFVNLLQQLNDCHTVNQLNHPSISGNLYLLHKLTRIKISYLYSRRSRNPYRIEQPHYLILADNNEIHYVGQNTVSKCLRNERSRLINNAEIGRYFTRFEGTYYVPNENLAKLYPDDTAAILEILSSQ